MSINEAQFTIDDLFGSGGKALISKDDPAGTERSGVVVSLSPSQATDRQTGEPRFSRNGNPLRQLVITLQTSERTPGEAADTGTRIVWVKAWPPHAQAFIDAVHAAGLSRPGDIKPGMSLTVKYVGEEPTQFGSPRKVYAYRIDPTITATVNEVNDAFAQHAPQPQATPAVPAPAQQQSAATPAASKDAVASLVAMGATDEQISEQLAVPVAAVRFVRSQLS